MNEQRKRILKMVEEGKLTVDEALVLLAELDKSTVSMEAKQDNLIKELSTFVQFDEKQKEGQKDTGWQGKNHSTKDKFFDFVDMAVKKLKDFDLDLNFGKHIEISHIFQQTDAFIKKMDIDVANGNITVIPWDQKDVRVECQVRVYRVDNQEQARMNFLKDVMFAIEGDCLRFSTGQKWMKLNAVLYIPQTDYEKIKIRMFNGNIDSRQLDVKKFRVKTANGKILMDEIKSSIIEAETANGAISFNNCVAADMEAETINGAITINGDFRKVELQSFNGDVECKVFGNRCEWIDAKTTTGGILLAVPEGAAVNGELKSNLGNFKVDVEGIQIVEEKSELIQKNLTFKSVKDAPNKIHLFADSKTGVIKISKS
ncbi:DUF4097 family beta strand repeat-containing protein [Bacillus benzoevorans]|uniref:DUF4097 and DUF4098 domain-containing protein YvlB n=1 Tax=Bacillus benzoevorans TaxID=1456 RepID=A0A7X0LW92_9BACI|nr:DUF4097 domain-containing protein [Bacillus benzoevorans]MBB6445109.1 DUF4097 and DUF4098 domain-containing protein YvlB [Bacillus benzoevorans]